MKKKNKGQKSIDIIFDVKDGKVKTEKMVVKLGEVGPIPFDKIIFNYRASLLNGQGTMDSLMHLKDITDGENPSERTVKAFESLIEVVGVKLEMDQLSLHRRIYELFPELDGMSLGFDEDILGFKIMENRDGYVNTLKEVTLMLELAHKAVKPKNPKKAKKRAKIMKMMGGSGIPVEVQKDLADAYVNSEVIMERIDKAEADGLDPEVTSDELQTLKDTRESMESVMKEHLGDAIKDKGGIA